MIIITGANGFVGQHLSPKLKKYFKKEPILCLVSKSMRSPLLEERGNKILQKNGLKMMEADLVTGKGLENLPKSPELIFHLAANTDTAKSDHRSNDIGTKNLLKALSPLDSKTHIIYTGTTIIHSGRLDCSKPITEETVPVPTNEYGRSKLRAEKFLREGAVKQGFRLTVTRLNTIYGGDPRTYKMFKVLKKNIQNGSLTTRFNWPGKTAIIHVADVASALLLLSKKLPKPKKPETYLLYAENPTLSEINRIMYGKMKIKYKPINLPRFIWRFCSFTRRFIPLFEKILPLFIYNLAWRFGLIVDDVIWCESDKAFKALPEWKPRKFSQGVEDEI